ncbi:AGAP001998-PA [Anopheles gambiae str. PEST]|uniref:Small ribosomal subunit protein uS10m n=2 Tax=gambiae species complex TaxID=44542 RepID=Q7PUN4_ANOGA|nr:28S ribosomal protein S10, mitochondrial [Anopheles coluzzii]XP_321061.3 small ribosomal subunit protein uS10m [Anopheles gambiae]EAA01263.4 AGAP001998-PA [Anopheles gambiae str. PEST]
MLKWFNITRSLAPLAPRPVRWYSDAVVASTSQAAVDQPPPVGVPDKLYSRVELQMKGIDPEVMKSYALYAKTAAEHLDIEVGKHWTLRKAVKDRLTLLKSVHIYKKHRVQYEVRNYYRFMHFHKLTGSTLDTFLEYIERNLPEGIALKVTKVELQELPEHLRK